MEHLYRLGLREAVAAIGGRRWTAGQVTRGFLARIEALEPEVAAWACLDADGALAQAHSADAALLQGTPRGGLHGAPVAVKDVIDVAGLPTAFGSPIHASAPPAAVSAECVQALERAGAIILGKTVTAEFAYYSPGPTRNPWNPAHTPGGSSMGSAAAVACGMAAGALGTQTNGSIIRPAAYCGVVGFKPSYGSVSNHGTLDPWPTLDHTGVFARTVADAAWLASHITRPGSMSGACARLAKPPKLAFVRSPIWRLAEPAQKQLMASTLAVLADGGATVEELELPPVYDDAHRIHRQIMAYEGARHFQALEERSGHLMSGALKALLEEGRGVAAGDYRDALAYARHVRGSYDDVIAGFDAVLTPPACGEAPATLEETGNPAFCTIWSLLGVPAVTLPAGIGPRGLPLGLQIAGRRGSDDQALAVAAWCESHLPFQSLVFLR
jgi:Asp-tRNA(Asn)/Glu-tRNA(Gln) amidotransferase A subunit family amidase